MALSSDALERLYVERALLKRENELLLETEMGIPRSTGSLMVEMQAARSALLKQKEDATELIKRYAEKETQH